MSSAATILVGAAVALVSCDDTRKPAVTGNQELRNLFEADQGERGKSPNGIDWTALAPRDEARRRRVQRLIESRDLQVPEDFYRAAMIFQHGPAVDDARKARELALQALKLRHDYPEAKWLAAAALDRELMMAGKPQKYGTQYRVVQDRFELYPVDPTTTDAERRKWEVPMLSEAQRTAADLNSHR